LDKLARIATQALFGRPLHLIELSFARVAQLLRPAYSVEKLGFGVAALAIRSYKPSRLPAVSQDHLQWKSRQQANS
jgi:hypothetical protein